jgi:tRNA (cytidine56-2'-O)-methyltransferase
MAWLKRFTRTGVAIHLTMYGIPFRTAIPSIRRDQPLCIVVGGAKVQRSVYDLCQHNVAVGNQPHSEVAALALFLDSWTQAPSLFEGARLTIEGNPRGKSVIENDEAG